jgi:phosphopantetheinyl transferase
VFVYKNSSQDNILALLAKRYFSQPEWKTQNDIIAPKQKRENLFSRIALKDAVRSCTARDGEMLYPIEFYCERDENGQPYLRGYGRAADLVDKLHVSLSHKDNVAAAIASGSPVGVDLEKIEEKSEAFMNVAYTPREIELLKGLNRPDAAIRFWVAKEACAKKTGLGLKGNPKRFEVTSVEGDILFVGDERVQTAVVGAEYIIGWTS